MHCKESLRSIFYFLPISVGLFFLLSCGSKKEIDNIGEAQQCLNQSVASTAEECTTKVEGITSVGAYNIRCAAAFIREGFANPTKYTTAFESLKGSSGTASFMGLITFSYTGNISTDLKNAMTTFNDCLSALAKGKTLISAFGYLSTAILNFFTKIETGTTTCSSPSSTGYNLVGCMQNALTSNPTGFLTIASTSADADEVQTSIGSVIISTYNISCSGTGANKDLCDKFSSAINNGGGTSNPRGVARQFLTTILPTSVPASVSESSSTGIEP